MTGRANEGTARKPKQAVLPFKSWGGAREGSGPKPKNGVAAGVSHRPREDRKARHPSHVMSTARHHASRGRVVSPPDRIDPFTSAPWFDGFRERVTVRGLDAITRPTTPARTWLLDTGWRRHGLIPLAAPA